MTTLTTTIGMHFRDLPDVVQDAVRSVGETARADGVRLFIFGSFARGDARPNSDLDLGYELLSESAPLVEFRLRRAVDRLPTIRPIDLVDFGQVSVTFRELAVRAILEL